MKQATSTNDSVTAEVTNPMVCTITFYDHGKEDEENHQRTGPSASSGVAIPYPCCPKEKVVVFPGAHGYTSIKCPNCGKYALFDYDNLTAKPGKVCRGASKRSCAVKS